LHIGRFELRTLSDGFFGLDGGAMFGVVPRVLWEKTNPPDRHNRIRLALRCLLVAAEDERIVVDTGVGRKYGAKFDAMFNLDDSDNLLASLARHGLAPEDITTVIQTHLHFDHCGWATRPDGGGGFLPTFPNARYVVQAAEWYDANHLNRRTRGSYRPDDFLPLEKAGLLQLVDGDEEIVPGVRVMRTGGHTRGHQIALVADADRTAVFWGDLIPTASHIEIPYIMGYDTLPLETTEQKERLVERAVTENWLCVFEHEPGPGVGHIRRDGKRYAFEPLPDDRQNKHWRIDGRN